MLKGTDLLVLGGGGPDRGAYETDLCGLLLHLGWGILKLSVGFSGHLKQYGVEKWFNKRFDYL